jgi:uncharacterized membrane protein YhaH (DUF805 family)
MIMKWYLIVLKKYAVFTGRARRKEYWMFFLFSIIFGLVASIIDRILGTTFKMNIGGTGLISIGYGYVYLLYSLATLIPSIAVGVRRLHDIGKSGWMLLVALIPFAGIIWLLVLLCTDSAYGVKPFG